MSAMYSPIVRPHSRSARNTTLTSLCRTRSALRPIHAAESADLPAAEETITARYGCELNPLGTVATHEVSTRRAARTAAGFGSPADDNGDVDSPLSTEEEYGRKRVQAYREDKIVTNASERDVSVEEATMMSSSSSSERENRRERALGESNCDLARK
mmetsp:Transcript_32746/g.75352  ORF Transcript_32746/g.75352 Transcript_32746/m.75352 type:complete len:157 (-) Transcript_32746:200-670(-)